MKDFINGLERGSFSFLSINPREFTAKVTCFDVNCLQNKAHMGKLKLSGFSHVRMCKPACVAQGVRRQQTVLTVYEHRFWSQDFLVVDSDVTSSMVLGTSLMAYLFKGLQLRRLQ